MNVNKVILIGNLGRESWVRPVVGEPRHTTVVAREPINMPHVELIDMVTELHKKIIMVTHKAGVVDCHIEDVQDRGGGLVPLHEGATGPPGARAACSRSRRRYRRLSRGVHKSVCGPSRVTVNSPCASESR
jgi:hypothetical protein